MCAFQWAICDILQYCAINGSLFTVRKLIESYYNIDAVLLSIIILLIMEGT